MQLKEDLRTVAVGGLYQDCAIYSNLCKKTPPKKQVSLINFYITG